MSDAKAITPRKQHTVNGAIITKQIYKLSKVMPKVWKQIEWYLSPQNKDENIRKDVCLALIKKALPNNLNAEDLRNQRNSNQILIITNGSQTQVETNGRNKVKVMSNKEVGQGEPDTSTHMDTDTNEARAQAVIDTQAREVSEDSKGGGGSENSAEGVGGAPKVESVEEVKDPHKISPKPEAKPVLDSSSKDNGNGGSNGEAQVTLPLPNTSEKSAEVVEPARINVRIEREGAE